MRRPAEQQGGVGSGQATVRERFFRSMAGTPSGPPIFAVYDWFVKNRPIDWERLFQRGLGQIAHAPLLRAEYPNAQIIESLSSDEGGERRDVRWVTDIGELHEFYRGEWRQEYLVKSPADYRILAHALENTHFTLDDSAFDRCEQEVGANGVTMGQLCEQTLESRSSLQAIQIDCAGLERFALDLGSEEPALMELIEQMDERTIEKFQLVRSSRATMIKLWENLSVETIGPVVYRRFLVPLYRHIFEVLSETGQGLHVHYDGKLRSIAAEIAELPFSGLDSLTGPPEGDIDAQEARQLWPDKYLWIHPNLAWYCLAEPRLQQMFARTVRSAGNRFCLMVSEEIPVDWQRTVPLVLETLASLDSREDMGGAS